MQTKMNSKTRNFLLLTDQLDKYSKFAELIVQQGFTVNHVDLSVNLGELLEKFTLNNTDKICIAILSFNSLKLTATDVEKIREAVAQGNSLIISGGDEKTVGDIAGSLNQLSSIYGVKFLRNSVIRPNLYKQYHPKEVMLDKFIVNRSFGQIVKKHCNLSKNSSEIPSLKLIKESSLRILYANGCSLQVDDHDSHTVMTSSDYAIPPNQSICTFYKGPNNSKVIVIGSASIMSDIYINCENNKALVTALLEICQDEHFSINLSDAKTLELPEMIYTGDMKTLIDIPIPCYETFQPVPKNKTELIRKHVFNFDCSKLSLVNEGYEQLDVPNKPLTLLRPKFHCQFLKLEPATHGFVLRTSKEILTQEETQTK